MERELHPLSPISATKVLFACAEPTFFDAYQLFRALQLEAPTPARITRIIHSARHTFEQQLYDTTLARLPEEVRAALDTLLTVDEHDDEEREIAYVVLPLRNISHGYTKSAPRNFHS